MRTWALVLVVVGLGGARAASAQTETPLPKAQAQTAAPQQPAVAPASDLSRFIGKPVAGVTVVLEGNVWNDEAPSAVRAVRVGEEFTPGVARRALEEVLQSGKWARGSVSVRPEEEGARIVVRAAPRRLVAQVQLDTHGARVDRRELLSGADLSEGGDIVGPDIPEVERRIAKYFALHGYPDAVVRLVTRPADSLGRVVVSVDVDAGAPRRIDERRFYVYDAPPSEVMPLARRYGVERHARADEPALDAADANLQDALQSSGWIRAHVTHDLVRVDAPKDRGRVWLRVRIDAGSRVVPRFEGNDHYDSDALTGALDLENETDRAIVHLCDKLRSFYVRRGFLDVEVRPEVRGRDTDPSQEVVFHITEHARVRVVARRYPCLSVDAIRGLSNGGPRTVDDLGKEIDSFLDEELPGADLLVDPDPVAVSATIGTGAEVTGARPRPIVLSPDTTYAAETYERAAEHIQELYRNEGFLHAEVGPLQLLRATCDRQSPPGGCTVVPPKGPRSIDVCTYDAAGLPLASEVADRSLTCVPNASRGVECARTVEVVLPIKLGPRTQLWDIAFTGVHRVGEKDVAQAADLALGAPVSTKQIEDGRRRIVSWYKEQGYAYVDVKYALEPSLDGTRARVRFDVVEGDRVFVEAIEIHGLERTHEGIVRRRIALREGEPYRTSDVLRTREQIATLGVFSSVSIGLGDPYVQQAKKTVVVDVVESASQYVEVRPGFSTGEGIRGVIEYGHRNILGLAWGVTAHVQASYLPDFLILDPGFAANYATVKGINRIATRDTLTFTWPEVGLGPTVRGQIDGIFVNDIERDFTLLKGAAIGAVIWRPAKELQLTTGPSLERNYVKLFDSDESIAAEIASNPGNVGLAQLLRVPDGESNVVAGRVLVAWDRRDSPFNAHSGTYVALGVEQVNSYPVRGTASPDLQYESHFFRLSQTIAAYVPITRRIALAGELRLGEIVNTATCKTPFLTGNATAATSPPPAYCTYPDRSFYMGGFDSMRGWLQDSFIPQEYADEIAQGAKGITCTSQSNCPGVPLRGGNFMVNPRVELRFPVFAPIDGALFGDFGNLWNDPKYVVDTRFTLRADVGAGVRVQTPVGPLVLDYGINVTRRPYEDFGAFHFAIGLF